MRRNQTGRTGGDETAPFDVYDYKAITAEDFVNEVLISEPYEWGYISVMGSGRVEYRDGKLLSPIPENWKGLTVVSVKGSGGWSRFDYDLKVT